VQETNNYKILIVDDEQSIIEFIEYNLQSAGYQTLTAQNGIQAIQLAKLSKPDLILLDVNMPKKDGYQTCKELRTMPEMNGTIIVFLTANASEDQEIKGLDSGADDYIIKPIKPNLLLSRLKSSLRNKIKEGENLMMEFNGLRINRAAYEIELEGTTIALARKEFELLAMLATKPNHVFNRNEILQSIWGNEVIVGDRTIDVHIRKIRQKLNEKYIYTVKGIGYKFQD
jgi:two-component system, OmpR family, alkaline phosphatase synthesis response regulator PhoP